MSFFKSLIDYGKQALGLTKRNHGMSGLINKARNFVSSGLNALNSSPVKSLVSAVSNYLPQAGDLYKGFKKYGNIANNVLNGGAVEKRGERVIKDSPLLSAIDRMGNVERPSPFRDYVNKSQSRRERTIERRPRINVVDNSDDYLGNAQGMF